MKKKTSRFCEEWKNICWKRWKKYNCPKTVQRDLKTQTDFQSETDVYLWYYICLHGCILFYFSVSLVMDVTGTQCSLWNIIMRVSAKVDRVSSTRPISAAMTETWMFEVALNMPLPVCLSHDPTAFKSTPTKHAVPAGISCFLVLLCRSVTSLTPAILQQDPRLKCSILSVHP